MTMVEGHELLLIVQNYLRPTIFHESEKTSKQTLSKC